MGDSAGSIIGGALGFALAPATGGASLALASAGAGAAIGGQVDAYRGRKQAASAQRDVARAQRSQARAQERSERAQSRMAQAEQQREIQRGLSQSRVQRAALRAQAEATGTGESSGVRGAMGSLISQTAEGIGNVGRNLQTGQYITNQNIAAGRAGSDAASAMGSVQSAMGRVQMANTISGIGGTVFDMAGGYESLFQTGAPTMPTAQQVTAPIGTPIQPRR